MAASSLGHAECFNHARLHDHSLTVFENVTGNGYVADDERMVN